MGYTNSSLAVFTRLSPNHSGQRNHVIDRISPHCVVGQCSAESLGEWFAQASTQASSNYGIDKDGRVALYVEEKNRFWCTSSNVNDQRAVTIECASDMAEPYWMNEKVYDSLIKLCTDICKRNGKKKLLWFADKDKSLNYNPTADEMLITVHRWFANKSCPGNWLYARLGDVAEKVTAALGGGRATQSSEVPAKEWYRVRKSWSEAKSQIGAYHVLENAKDMVDKNEEYFVFDEDGNVIYPEENTKCPFLVSVDVERLNIRKGPGTDYETTGKYTGKGVFTIVKVQEGKGSDGGWGHLKSGAGWICLDYCDRV